MGLLGRILSFNHNSAEAVKETVLKTDYYSIRLIKDADHVNSVYDSSITNILLNGKCIDPETRCLYLFYIDTFFNAAWIIEINIDTRVQTVVLFDRYNDIGFNPKNKIYNARVVYGRIIWTDNVNPIYQVDIKRAKNSFLYGIGYNQNNNIQDWEEDIYYYPDQIVAEYQHFYRCLVANIGFSPLAYTGYWQQLCRIEDAYYSIKIENFYFAPMPPLLPPVVTYLQDDTRRLNNLRQTLFQFAYNYIYMDYRESTYSPASIVPMPDGEEEVATGQQTEDISKNNCLKIQVNTGGEEVRKIRIIGRSSADTLTWFLVEEIDKFDLEEERYSASPINDVGMLTLTITLPLPIVTGEIVSNAVQIPIALSSNAGNQRNLYLMATNTDFEWASFEFTDFYILTTTITHSTVGNHFFIENIPTWLGIVDMSDMSAVINGSEFRSGVQLGLFPTSENFGAERSGQIRLYDTSAYENELFLEVVQRAGVTPVSVEVEVIPGEVHDLEVNNNSGSNTPGYTYVTFQFFPMHPDYGGFVAFDMQYEFLLNGVSNGTGFVTVYNTLLCNTGDHMLVASAPGDVVTVHLWENPKPT